LLWTSTSCRVEPSAAPVHTCGLDRVRTTDSCGLVVPRTFVFQSTSSVLRIIVPLRDARSSSSRHWLEWPAGNSRRHVVVDLFGANRSSDCSDPSDGPGNVARRNCWSVGFYRGSLLYLPFSY